MSRTALLFTKYYGGIEVEPYATLGSALRHAVDADLVDSVSFTVVEYDGRRYDYTSPEYREVAQQVRAERDERQQAMQAERERNSQVRIEVELGGEWHQVGSFGREVAAITERDLLVFLPRDRVRIVERTPDPEPLPWRARQ